MSAIEFFAWLRLPIIVIGGAVGLWLVWWSLLGDVPRGQQRGEVRRRCPFCWHNMKGVPGLRCPECGRTVAAEDDLHRTRRRWPLAVLSIIALSLGASHLIIRTSSRGWTSLMPSRLLIAVLPLTAAEPNSISAELAARARNAELSDGGWRSLVARCAKGDARAVPWSQGWRAKYQSYLKSRYLLGQVAPTNIDESLQLVPGNVLVRASRLRDGEREVALQATLENHWPSSTAARVRVSLAHEPEPRIVLHRNMKQAVIDRAVPFRLPIREDAESLVLRIVIDNKLNPGDAWRECNTQVIVVPIERDQNDASQILPLENDVLAQALEAQLQQVFAPGLLRWPSGPRIHAIRFQSWHTLDNRFKGIAIGVIVEVMFDDTVARTSRLWWAAGTQSPAGIATWLPSVGDDDLLLKANSTDGRWRLRIRSDETLARRVQGPVDRYWIGEFEIPLRVLANQNPSVSPEWEVIKE